MGYKENVWLEKYEIKKPDYDWIERNHIGMKDVIYEPSRYVKKNNVWVSKRKILNFFGKKRVRLMFVGDITCFDKQFVEARCGENYDFSYEFEKVSPIFSEADLVVGNLETMIVPEAPYRSEKHVSEQNFHCNAPNEFLDALRKAGIDVLTNANNHSLDTGTIGIGETIDNIVRFGFIQTGTFKTEKKRYEIIDVAGFKIAIVAFTMEHNNKKCNLTSDGIEFLLNDYSPEKARKIINDAHGDGAELVFTCIHWGSENKCVQNNVQIKTANELADMGYDCIIGSHPHVLQPFNFINTNNKKVPVFYSMGNFISHNANNQKSRSIIACVELKRQEKNISMTCSYIPVFTSDNYGDKKYIVLPINNLVFDSRNRKRLVKIKKTIGKEIKINKNIQFSEYVEKEEAESLSEVSQEISEIDVSSITEYPVEYHDKKFTYLIYKEYAYITGFFGESSVGAWSIPEKIGDLPIKGISEGAFSQNQIVKKINFRKNITVISRRMCKNCRALEGVQLGSSTVEIQDEAFAECVSLASFVMKNTVKKVGSKAFYNCSGLRSVKIPNGVSEIAEDAFVGCGKVVFYCEKDSYAEMYAKKHSFKIINMNLY